MIFIDFSILVLMLLPIAIRKPVILQMFSVVNQSTEALQNDLIQAKNDADYLLIFDCRRIYFEHFLNDQHDFALRRIFIRDVVQQVDPFSFLNDELNEPIYSYLNSESPTDEPFSYMSDEVEDLIDFEVVVPIGFIYDEPTMIKHIDTYRLPGKTYQIVEE